MAEVQYKRRFGDRKEGRQLHSTTALSRISPFVARRRSDALGAFRDSVEVTDTESWLRDKRAEGYKGMGMLHLFIASYIRMLSLRPALNRFVAGQRIFARHDIEVLLTVKRADTPDAAEVTVKMVFDPSDTVFDVYRKLGVRVDEIMADTQESDSERVAANLIRLPRVMLRIIMGLMRLCDYYGWLPQAFLDASPWHGSVTFSDMGALGTLPFTRGITNFGCLPLHITFGSKRKAIEVEGTGRAAERHYIDYAAAVDERICDSATFASAFRYLNYFLSHPEALEQPPERIEEDVF